MLKLPRAKFLVWCRYSKLHRAVSRASTTEICKCLMLQPTLGTGNPDRRLLACTARWKTRRWPELDQYNIADTEIINRWMNNDITSMTAGARKTQQMYKNRDGFCPSICSTASQNFSPPNIQLMEIV